jgi:hypothetical protein
MTTTSRTIQGISYKVKETVTPLLQVMAIFKGVRQGIDTASKIFNKRKGGKNV